MSLPSFWRPCRAWWLGLLLPQISFSRYTFSDIRYVPLSSRLNLANRAVFEEDGGPPQGSRYITERSDPFRLPSMELEYLIYGFDAYQRYLEEALEPSST